MTGLTMGSRPSVDLGSPRAFVFASSTEQIAIPHDSWLIAVFRASSAFHFDSMISF